ncbi:hypoxanthine phosphoribosyltransferase [candidate division WOR-3 bacterium]|uniref:Hypoxanthine phosphoribosyltransferase n=1 Tax=candidate division WOR-3 bacterium TaxID=2052148 RepID=A0A9D5QDY8_UNCW3|nr:hypoxanthine phosphoribosyltransferase [candidate division WOR-3 bacterium]MBD3365547.1 hypoxanthine phosphoribosyltransferase [candidate division WOR-3 bacterium]
MNDKPTICTLFTEEEILERVDQLGAEIGEDYAGKNPLLVGVLKGAWVFLADLTRAVTIPHEADFIQVSSYGSETQTSGVVKLVMEPLTSLAGRDVILVEDIVDSGYTLKKLVERFKAQKPTSVEICALLDKPERREVKVDIKYTGFPVPNKFVVGYGIDWDERFRHLPYIGYLEF